MCVRNRVRRLLLAAVLTAAVLALAGGSASAIRLSLGESTFRSIWTPVRFTIPGNATISCNLTLEGSFNSPAVTKTERSLIGYVTRGTSSSCTGGGMLILREMLPWQVQYGGFTGTLPAISAVTTRIVAMQVGLTYSLGLICIARSEANAPARLVAERSGGVISSFRWDETVTIPAMGTAGCVSAGVRASGTSSSATALGSSRTIALALIGDIPTLSPSPVEFGTVEVESVPSRTVTIRAGTGSVQVRSIALRSGASFSRLDPNRCIGSTLPERGTCAFTVIFAAPREAGRTFEDTVSVVTDAGTVDAAVRAAT